MFSPVVTRLLRKSGLLAVFAFAAIFPAVRLHGQSAIDSLDVLHYTIHVDTIVNTASVKTIDAHTEVQFTALAGQVSRVQLNLLEMTVDSVKLNNSTTAYSYNDTILEVLVPGGFTLSDTHSITVWYTGRPQQDPAFGGFYFAGSYVYNIGVGFSANPVNLSRVWFPSHDNFTDRATFDFHIRTNQGLVASCNGNLESQTLHADSSTTWHWRLQEDIPPYLAGMAVAPYEVVHDFFFSISGDTIPFEIYAVATDTTNAKNQSANLKAGMAALEQRFGAYRWNRLGFVMVNMPLTGVLGAMEHATNIVYPRYFLTQGQSFETIWAHEAGHAWFGNLVTCESESQMWLNEGWASYTEYIFTEAIYGQQALKDYFRSTHATVLRRAFVEEGAYYPLDGIPHAHVYGRTVYSKGSTIAHTLRYQIGDSLFFPAVRNYLDSRAHQHAHTDSLERSLEAFTQQDWTPFFDGWVRQGGAPHFSVDSFIVTSGGPMNLVTTKIRQQLRGATQFADSVRVTIRYVGANREMQDENYVIGGVVDSVSAALSFVPVAVCIDPEERMADATTDNYRTISSIGNYSFPQTWFTAMVDNVADTTWLRVVHNWVPATGNFATPAGLYGSTTRYWTIEGTFPAGFDARATFQYNGSTNSSTGLLDHYWLTSEDSVVLLYRRNSGDAWHLAPGQTKAMGSLADKQGSITVDSLVRGEYAFGYWDRATGLPSSNLKAMQVWPNPNDGSFHVRVPDAGGRYRLTLLDATGKQVHLMESESEETDLQLQNIPAGIYFLTMETATGQTATERIVISK